ncbi:hypothetical protein GCM10010466_11390 [Planomonospora alba]|uniref:Secreted protein n=1 Tax=Planomonospora alba TaxID=161354 RepID=A0ABP6MQ70_9ACTN
MHRALSLAVTAVLVIGGSALPAVPADAKPRVNADLNMSVKLRKYLAKLWEASYSGPRYRDRAVRKSDLLYGRVENRYYAILCIYYRDSPVGSTDCGTIFKKVGKRGIWRITQSEGGFYCYSRKKALARPLARAWEIPRC